MLSLPKVSAYVLIIDAIMVETMREDSECEGFL